MYSNKSAKIYCKLYFSGIVLFFFLIFKWQMHGEAAETYREDFFNCQQVPELYLCFWKEGRTPEIIYKIEDPQGKPN